MFQIFFLSSNVILVMGCFMESKFNLMRWIAIFELVGPPLGVSCNLTEKQRFCFIGRYGFVDFVFEGEF